MNQETVGEWARRNAEGESLASIGREVGLSRERIRQIMRQAGYPVLRNTPRPWSRNKYASALDALNAGEGFEEVASRFGYMSSRERGNFGTVANHYNIIIVGRENRMVGPKHHLRTYGDEVRAEAVRLRRDEGMGYVAIGKRLGIGAMTARRICLEDIGRVKCRYYTDRSSIRSSDSYARKTREDAAEIIAAWHTGCEPCSSIAKRFGVSAHTVWDLTRGLDRANPPSYRNGSRRPRRSNAASGHAALAEARGEKCPPLATSARFRLMV